MSSHTSGHDATGADSQRSFCLSARRSAKYLDVSVSYFRARIAPELCSVDFAMPSAKKRMPRWSIADLDRWAESRRAA